MKKIFVMLSLTCATVGLYAQHDHAAHGAGQSHAQTTPPSFKDKKLEAAYTHYIDLKNALVSSKQAEAKKAADELVKSLDARKGSKTYEAALGVSAATTLADQREAFTALSNEMATLVKSGKLASGAVYLEYCPMANNNSGGYWLSNEKEIRNPYFGDQMLKCGSVKEVIQ